jgi:beta-lactamase class A
MIMGIILVIILWIVFPKGLNIENLKRSIPYGENIANLRKKDDSEIYIHSNKYDWYVDNVLKQKNTVLVNRNSKEAIVSSVFGDQLKIKKGLKRINTQEVISDIEATLGDGKGNYSLYVYDINRDQEINYLVDTVRPPASVSKLPVAMLILRDIQAGKYSLETTIEIKRSETNTLSNVLDKSDIGKSFSIDQFLHWLLIDSDNISIRVLEEHLGGVGKVNERTINELGLNPFFRDPHQTTAKNIGTLLRKLYFHKYLDQNHSDYMLNLMLNTPSHLQEELPQGLPPGTKFAHKTGRVWTIGGGVAFVDVGIVYGPESNYIIVYLNQNVSIKDAQSNAKKLSELIYNKLQQ